MKNPYKQIIRAKHRWLQGKYGWIIDDNSISCRIWFFGDFYSTLYYTQFDRVYYGIPLLEEEPCT